MTDRIPCINPRCRRTAPADKYNGEVVCRKCFRSLPRDLQQRYRKVNHHNRRMCRLISRRVAKGTIAPDCVLRLEVHMARRSELVWAEIKRHLIAPSSPVGLDNFLQEVGLA